MAERAAGEVGRHRPRRVVAATAGAPAGGVDAKGIGHRRDDRRELHPTPHLLQLRQFRLFRPVVEQAADAVDERRRADDQPPDGGLKRRRWRLVHARPKEPPIRPPGLRTLPPELPQHPVVTDPIQLPGGADVARTTSPGPLLGPLDQPGPDRVEVDVAADLEEVAFLFDQVALEAPLKQVPAATVAAVEVPGVAPVELLHAGREVRLGRFDEQVLVIAHQDEGVQPPAVDLDGAPQPRDPLVTVGVIADNGPPLVTAGDDVVEGTSELDAKWSRHARKPTTPGNPPTSPNPALTPKTQRPLIPNPGLTPKTNPGLTPKTPIRRLLRSP